MDHYQEFIRIERGTMKSNLGIKKKHIAFFAMLLLCLANLAFGQTIVTGGINGTVTDPSGAVVAGVKLTVKSAATGETTSTTSSATGDYQLPLLKPGEYTLTVNRDGFKTLTRAVTVLLGQNSTINLALELGAGTATIEVTSEQGALQTENANITTTFDTHMVQSIPNPGNDITYIAQTAPGVSMNTSSGNGYGNFSAFGLPGTANLFTINGNDYNDPYLNLNNSGASNLLLGTNDVQEVAVVSNGYTGQYGRQAGAQIDVSTKSGTNAFHGGANYYWTGRALDANDFFLNQSSQPRPFQNNNNWAADLGGPIKKNKAFFFVDTEGLRYIFATATQATLPTPAFQSFVLGQNPSETSFYQQIFGLYNGVKGIANAVPQSGTCPGIGGSSVNALPGGSTQCLETITGSGSSGNKEWLLIGQVDYNLSDRDKISGRVKFDRGVQPTYADPINSAFNAISRQPQNEGQLNYTHVFSPSVFNNFVFSDLWYSAIFQSTNISQALTAFPEILCSADTSMSCLGPTGGLFPFGFFFPQGRNVEQWQLVDDLSIARGRHTFKVGANFRRDDVSDYRASEDTAYPSVMTSLAGFASNAIDTSVSQNFALSSPQPLAIYSFGLYFQDELRVSSKLKLTLALRADRNSGGKCQTNCSSLSTDPFNLLDHTSTGSLYASPQGSILRSVEKVVFEPRIGFAWTPFGQDTVLRGGVGLFTDLYPGTILDNFTTNFPEVNSISLAAGTINPADPNSGATIVGQCNSNPASNPACAGVAPPLYDVVRHLNNPKYTEWNVELQHGFGHKLSASLNYVGNRGTDLLLVNPYLNAFGFGSLPNAAVDTRVATVQQLTNNGHSNYNGVTASVRQNAWHGFSAQFSYTYSHALDNVSNGGILPYSLNNSLLTQIDPQNPNASYGSADYDLRHLLSANYVWDLPLRVESHHLLNTLVSGWQISGTFFRRTGFPFSLVDGLTESSLLNNNMVVNGSPVVTVLAQPLSGVSIPMTCGASAANSATPCFSSSDFSTTPSGFIGSLGRNALRGPSYFNTDLSLKKTVKLNERMGLTIGANAFNILNHPNFQNPVDNLASSSFGQIVSTVSSPTTPYGAFASAAEDMRILQVVAKLTF
jgi:outer membrane receptor protein involved in Fe transport